MAFRLVFGLVLLLAATIVSGCSRGHYQVRVSNHQDKVVVRDAPSRQGPPPHAPAHGYRHKHGDGARLRYDAGLGVYIVIGHADTWFFDDLYFRWSDGRWVASVRLDGGWSACPEKQLPHGLREKKHGRKGKRH